MLTKFDKAWVSALVSFGSLTAAQFFGFELDTNTQVAVVSLVLGAITWIVPNKA